MATVNPPAQGVRQIDVEGTRYTQGRDGRFHDVADHHVKKLVKGGECFLPQIRAAASKPGYRCQACGFLAVFRDHCGRCGGSDLVQE